MMITALSLTDIVTIFLGVSTFLLVSLLPAIVELKRPKDKGPRTMPGTILAGTQTVSKSLKGMEEETGFDRVLAGKIAGLISILPNLEE